MCLAIKTNGKPCRQMGKPKQSGGPLIAGFCEYHKSQRSTDDEDNHICIVIEEVVEIEEIEEIQPPHQKSQEHLAEIRDYVNIPSWPFDTTPKSMWTVEKGYGNCFGDTKYFYFQTKNPEWWVMPRGYAGGLKEYMRFKTVLEGHYRKIKYRVPVKMDIVNKYCEE